jgi:hypothetical protein
MKIFESDEIFNNGEVKICRGVRNWETGLHLDLIMIENEEVIASMILNDRKLSHGIIYIQEFIVYDPYKRQHYGTLLFKETIKVLTKALPNILTKISGYSLGTAVKFWQSAGMEFEDEDKIVYNDFNTYQFNKKVSDLNYEENK